MRPVPSPRTLLAGQETQDVLTEKLAMELTKVELHVWLVEVQVLQKGKHAVIPLHKEEPAIMFVVNLAQQVIVTRRSIVLPEPHVRV